jgi:hypothetical protein
MYKIEYKMLNKKNMLKCVGALLVLSALVFSSCGNEIQKKDSSVENVGMGDTLVEEAQMDAMAYSLPSPLQIASVFRKPGVKYKEGLTSQLKDPTKYRTRLKRALNMGVYSADLSYGLLHNQCQVAMEYMKLTKQTADEMGMGSVFEVNNMRERFEENIENEDSLTLILSELQMEMDLYLDENNQKQITAIAFAGAWIESIYIGSKVYGKSTDQALNAKLSDQMAILESIIKALKAGEKMDSAITGLIAELQVIQNKYESFETVKKYKSSRKAKQKIILTDEEIAVLTKEIELLRFKFITS